MSSTNDSRPHIGVIGLGIMGSAMAANLMRAGHRVTGYDISAARLDAHRRAGGEAAESVGELARRARIIISSLPSSDALAQTAAALVHAKRPVTMRQGRKPSRTRTSTPRPWLVIETSTLPLVAKERARKQLERAGMILLDCPLSGTGAQARTKDLVVYASGDRRACRRVQPVLNAFARAQYYVGPFGAGSKMKFVANLLVAIHNVAAAEALVLARKAGLDPALVLQAVGDGAGSSRMLQVRGPMMAAGDYSNATMKLEVWQKDMAVIAGFARDVGAPTPLFSATVPLYAAAVAAGREREDTAAVCAILEQLAGGK